ncbi:MAG TPA: NTP transferase domain-containing protein [Micromonosporaceae bacterium]
MARFTDLRYVVVQAGGRGSRLGHLTANRPKCLLSIDGEPLLYRLFRQFPKARFLVVVDTHADALDAYLSVVPPPVPVTRVPAIGSGSAAGLRAAIDQIVEDEPFAIVWCDLFFDTAPGDLEVTDQPVLGLSGGRFTCRWSVDEQGHLVEAPDAERGIAGLFAFPDRGFLRDVPDDGEFVRFLRDSAMAVRAVPVPGIREFGTLAAVEQYTAGRQATRFFNHIEVSERQVVKSARLPEFEHLIEAEANWYELVEALGFQHTPKLRSRAPLTIDRVAGHHPFELTLDDAGRDRVLSAIMDCLSELHALRRAPGDPTATQAMYHDKAVERVTRIRPLIPQVDRPTLTVNGLRCRNPLHSRYVDWFRDKVDRIGTATFALIHGDPTFSNMLVTADGAAWLIDPRGTFGAHAYHGDPRYDWAKLLYSVAGNYDQFNRRQFRLRVDGDAVSLSIGSNGWERQAGALRERIGADAAAIDLIHASIWLSLSGYVLDDLDSVLAAFYNGIHYLELTER